LEWSNIKTKLSRQIVRREIERVADRRETAIVIPVIVVIVQVELTIVGITIEVRHLPIAIELADGIV
jgi:hypothetical protein